MINTDANMHYYIHGESCRRNMLLKILKGTITIIVLLVCVVTFVIMLVNVYLQATVWHNLKTIVFN